MANAQQVKALIRSHAEGDDERFYAIALQMAAEEARLGHQKFAIELRKLVDEVRSRVNQIARPRPIPIVQPQGELAGLLSASYPKARLKSMILEHSIAQKLETILLEQRQRDRLKQHSYQPSRKLLLVGPPGTGKTLSACTIAGELGLPLFTILIDGLITKFLGETAAKLRLIFDAIQRTRAVYLFDEFDALGGERSSRNDVGEIRRVLNSFLQFLEQDESDSVIIAATNYPALLDKALFRRFDMTISFELPSEQSIENLMRARLNLLDTSQVDWAKSAEAAKGLSHGDIAVACEQAAKKVILGRTSRIGTNDILASLSERRSIHP